VNRDIYQNQEAIHVLKAEWSFLNDPARLRDLSITVLGMQPVKPSAIASLNDLSGPSLGTAVQARADAIKQEKAPKGAKNASSKPAPPVEAVVPRKIEMAQAPKAPAPQAAAKPQRPASRPEIEPMAAAILSIAGLKDFDPTGAIAGAMVGTR
jgi:hypothetical protein